MSILSPLKLPMPEFVDRLIDAERACADRSRIAAELLPTMLDRIVRRFQPLRIILFGSQARGQAGPASDIDLLVVLSEVANKRQVAVEIRRLLADLPVGKDIIVTTQEEITRRGDWIGGVLRPAVREGKVLYERN
jgi:uncharacterized protein